MARSTFPSQNVQITLCSDHFWKLRCRKSSNSCGAKHMSKSKSTKHTMFGPLLEVQMSKKCTLFWREAHFQVKMYKTHHVQCTCGSWDVKKAHAFVARSTFPSQNVQSTRCTNHFWKLRGRKSARRCGAKHASKSKCTKHNNVGPFLEVQMSKLCVPLWREAHVQVNNVKTWWSRTTFGSWDVKKVQALVARSTFPSQNVQSTRCTDHFWKLRGRKKCTPCGPKQISKSKCTKHNNVGPFLEVQMSKMCVPLWREAHFQVKLYKAQQRRTILEVQMSKKCMPLRSTFSSQSVQNTRITDHFWRFRCGVAWHGQGIVNLIPKVNKTWGLCSNFNYNHQYTTLHYTTLHYTTLHYTTLHYTTLHYTTLHYTTLHYTTPQYTTLHSTPLHSIPPHHTTLHHTTLQYTTLHPTTLHSTTLSYTTLRYTALRTVLHYTTLHYIALYHTTLHSTPFYTTPDHTTLHYITLHYTTPHYTTPHYTTLHHITLHYATLRYTSLRYATLHLQQQPQLQLRCYIAPPYITLLLAHYTSTI